MTDPRLAAALAALHQRQRGEALDLLLEIWREHRDVPLSELITRLGIEAARGLPPIEGRTRALFQQAWLDVANQRRAVDVPRLLAVLRHPPWTLFAQRLDRLQALPADPRIGLSLAQFLEELPVMSSLADSTWRALVAVLVRSGDARCRPPLEFRRAQPGRSVLEQTVLNKEVARALEALPPPPSGSFELAALEAAVDALEAGPPPDDAQRAPRAQHAERDEGSLLSEIWGAPAQDAPRHVYADWLLERSDPRGEFLTLQLQRAPKRLTVAQRKREAALLKANRRAWLGPLEPAIDQSPEGLRALRFSRGFLAEAVVRFPTARALEELAEHPAWNTLERLVRPPARMVERTELAGLRALELRFDELVRLVDRKAPLAALTALRQLDPGVPPSGLRRALASSPLLPALEELAVTHGWFADDVAWLEERPLGARLRTLRLSEPVPLEAALRRAEGLLARFPRLERLEPNSTLLRFAREGGRWWIEVENPWSSDVVLRQLSFFRDRYPVRLRRRGLEPALLASLLKALSGYELQVVGRAELLKG